MNDLVLRTLCAAAMCVSIDVAASATAAGTAWAGNSTRAAASRTMAAADQAGAPLPPRPPDAQPIPPRPADVGNPNTRPPDVGPGEPGGRPADVGAGTTRPPDVEGGLSGRPADVGSGAARPSDVEGGLSGRPADVDGPPGRPADIGGQTGRPADVGGDQPVGGAADEPSEAGAADDDAWGFAEEEDESLVDILRQQAMDLGLLVAFLTVAMVSFFRKSVALKYLTLVLCVAYMGFTKSQLLSIVNVFGVLDWNWPIFKYNLPFYLLFGFTVTTTVLWGRVYCGRICAFGAFTQLMDKIVPPNWKVDVPASIEKRAAPIKFGILALVVAYFLATHDISVYRYVEPFWMFGLSEKAVMWAGLAVLLVATVFVRNLYCRFLCPLGATLGLISFLTVFKIKRWSECKTCRICEKACEYGAIQGPKILVTECVRCDDCERIYADDDKCPHWLIPKRKAAKANANAAVQSRPTTA